VGLWVRGFVGRRQECKCVWFSAYSRIILQQNHSEQNRSWHPLGQNPLDHLDHKTITLKTIP